MIVFDVFAWIVFLLLVSMAVGIIAFMGVWPGRVARARNHPQAEAITVGSWLTLFLGVVLWPVVAIWAHMRPIEAVAGTPAEDLTERLRALEGRIAALEAASRSSEG